VSAPHGKKMRTYDFHHLVREEIRVISYSDMVATNVDCQYKPTVCYENGTRYFPKTGIRKALGISGTLMGESFEFQVSSVTSVSR